MTGTSRWLLPEGTRVLHIGPPFTGGGAIRGALGAARDELADQGVELVEAGEDWRAAVAAMTASEAARVIVSSDLLAEADAPTIHAIASHVDPDRVHVIATLRPLADVLRRQWQQLVLDGETVAFDPWLDSTLAGASAGEVRGFWLAHRHDLVVARWANAFGPEHVTAIVTGEGRRVAGTIEALLGLRRRTLEAIGTPETRLLTLPEVEVVRAINVGLRNLQVAEGQRADAIGAGAVPQLLRRAPRQGEPQLGLSAVAADTTARLGREAASSIGASGVHIVGDLDELLVPVTRASETPPAIDDATWAEIGAQAAVGILRTSGLLNGHRPSPSKAEPLELAGISTVGLGLLLVRRGLRSLASARERAAAD